MQFVAKTKTQFVKSGSGLFNKAVSNLPFELHLPGHNFTGPGAKLDRRLNPDGTPIDWSKPINRVDEAAYHLCYAKNPDTRTRNEVCDREMLRELAQITNPSLRERSKQASNFIRQNNEKNTNILSNHEYYTFGGLPVKLSLILAGHPFY